MEPSAISCENFWLAHYSLPRCLSNSEGIAYLLEVLALELSNELLEALGVSVDTDGGENLLDIGSGGLGVAGKSQEKVGSEVLHFECTFFKSVVSNFDLEKNGVQIAIVRYDR